MIRIALIADTHADETRLFDEHQRVMGWVAGDIRERKCDLVVHLGDVWERTSTSRERAVVGNWFREVAEDADVVVVPGNHDDEIDVVWLSKLRTKHTIHAFDYPCVVKVAGVAVGILPWPRQAQLVATHLAQGGGSSREELAEFARETLRNIIAGLADEMEQAGGPRLFATHAMVSGARTDQDQPLVAGDMELTVDDLGLARAHFCGVGHVHAQNNYTFGSTTIAYPGSPLRQNFGEPGPKGYIIVEIEGEDVRWKRVPTPAAPMLLVEGAWTESGMTLAHSVEPHGCKIRLRYSVDSDRRVAASAAAALLEAEWLNAGALDVVVDPVVNPILRARAAAVAVAAALTPPEQLTVYWRERKIALSPEREERLLSLLPEVTGPNALLRRPQTRGGYGFDRLRYSGFRGVRPMDINLAALPGPLVAFTGENGAGKTMALGMLYAAIHRQVPTRGTLNHLALARDAQLEVDFTTGGAESYTVKHLVDGQSSDGKVVLTDRRTGKSVLKGTSVKAFAAHVAANFPSPSVIKAGMFAAQGDGGLLDMEPADRKAVILRLEGADNYEGWSKKAREKARDAREASKIAAARLQDERGRSHSLHSAELNAGAADERLVAATGLVERHQAELKAAEAAEAAYREQLRLYGLAAVRREELAATLLSARTNLADYEKRVANNTALLADAAKVEESVAELARVAAREAALAVELAQAEAAETAARVALTAASAEHERTRAEERDLGTKEAALQLRLRDKADAERAAERIPSLQTQVASAAKVEAEAEAERERLQGVALVGAEGRIKGLRGGLARVAAPSDGDDLSVIAGQTLDADTVLETNARTVPGLAANAKAVAAAAARTHRELRDELARAERVASRLPDLLAVEAEIVGVAQKRAQAREACGRAQAAEARSLGESASERASASALRDERAGLAAARQKLEPQAKLAERLAGVPGRLEELRPGLALAKAEVARIEAALDAIPLPAVPQGDAGVLEAARRLLEQAVEEQRAARDVLAQAKRDVEVARLSEVRLEELARNLRACEETTADWTLLADSLGLDGIQAMLVENAGPELTTLVNDLLHTCHGPRFSMRIDASRTTSDGKKEVEGCEINVMDARDGSDRPGETFSGGEKAFLAAALRLAVTMRQCRGLRGHTLIQDEPTSTLSASAGRAYIAMLRRAAEVTGAARVLFVSHHPEEIALADARVHFTAPDTASKTVVQTPNSAPRAVSGYLPAVETLSA